MVGDMRPTDKLLIRGAVRIVTRDATTGRIIAEDRRSNLVVNAGLDLIVDRLQGVGSAAISHFAIGDNNAGVAAGQTALQSEQFRDTVTLFTDLAQGLEVQYFLADTDANGVNLREAGVFNAGAAGTMFARVVHSDIAKTALITVTYAWTFNLAGS
jgi:hypothetical protein